MRERPAWPHLTVKPKPASEFGIRAFHSIYRGLDHSYVGYVHAAIMIEIIHATIAVRIDDHVNRIAVLMPALTCSAAGVSQREVVRRRPEAGQNFDVLRRYAMNLKIGEHKLELVQQRFAQDDVLGKRRPVMRNEITKREMIGYVNAGVFGCDLYKACRIIVSVGAYPMQLARPEPNIVCTDCSAALCVERDYADECVRMPRHTAWDDVHSRWCASRDEQMYTNTAAHAGACVATFCNGHRIKRCRFTCCNGGLYRRYGPHCHSACRSVLRTMVI